ncbi:MAG: hypothetical protein Q9207_000999 [Kuettlingeria erythrocarpa]
MNKPASIFSGGWTPEKAEKFKSIQLPDKCKGCHKLKPVVQYSNKQQLDLKQRIAGHQGQKAKLPTAEIITCRTCTSGQTQELTCMLCGEAKGLEAFGKGQRKNPDTARCTVCVHEQGKEKWAHVEWNQDDDEDEDSDAGGSRARTNPYEHEYSHTRDEDVDAVSSALKEANLAAYNRAHGQIAPKHSSTIVSGSDLLKSYSDEEFAKENTGKGKGKEKPQNWQGFADGDAEKKPQTFIGYDSKGGAHHQVRQPSTAASGYSVEIQTESPRGRPGHPTAKGGKFAKPPRGLSPVPRPGNMIEQLKANTGGRTIHSDDEETEDEDWGYV